MGLIVMLVGSMLLAYPPFVNSLYQARQRELVADYTGGISQKSAAVLAEERAAAAAYNEALLARTTSPQDGDSDWPPEEYWNLLDFYGMMGSVEIPAVGIHIGLFHGTGDRVLLQGAGHLETSSLPVGGAGSHCVITAHSGLASARLFTDLEKVETGDVIYLHVLDETLAYEVEAAYTVEPYDTSDLAPREGEDIITLITCTPFAINSHRLFVRAQRCEYLADIHEDAGQNGASPKAIHWQYLVFLAVAVFCAAHLLHQQKARRRKGEKNV